MEKQEKLWQRQSLMDMMRRKRHDPAGDVPFDPDEEPEAEDGKAP